jgi:hypothetical protein
MVMSPSSRADADLMLLGRPAEQGRWFLIPLGMLILLCLGSVYSWSILLASPEVV